MKNILKKTSLVVPVLVLIILWMTHLTAYAAADVASLELGRTGSIQMTLADTAGKMMSDGTVTLYQVAGLTTEDGNMTYQLTEDFVESDIVPDLENSSQAERLAAYASRSELRGTAATPDANGVVRFENLPLGLYLVVNTQKGTGDVTFEPFVVTVPLAQDGAWNYEVDSSPKVSVQVPPTTPGVPNKPTTPGPKLPQTGQLSWPIPVLAGCGLALFLLGWGLYNSRSRKENHEA